MELTEMVGEARSGELFEMWGKFTYRFSEMEESTDVLTRFLLPACLEGLRLPLLIAFEPVFLVPYLPYGYGYFTALFPVPFFLTTPISL